jgi:predicted amidohydrolase YtcJ
MRRSILAFVTLALVGCPGRQAGPAPAELMLTNGQVETMVPGQARVAELAVDQGRIVAVGPQAAKFQGPATHVVDLGGRLVLPGLVDGHVHLLSGGLDQRACSLAGAADRAEVERRIAAYAKAHPKEAWIHGNGWELPIFPHANPRREWLDKLVPDRPAYFEAADGHTGWANTKALALAGIQRGTPDPEGGRIERESYTGLPSGTLRESAKLLVERLLPEPTEAERVAAMTASQRDANALGITSVLEAKCEEADLRTYHAMDLAGTLHVRVTAAHLLDPAKGAAQVPRLVALRQAFGSEHVAPRVAKIFIDGVIEARTAALLSPYLDPRTRKPTKEAGTALWTQASLDETVVALDRAGFQVHMHALGDRAVRMGLDAVAAARRANGPNDARHTIAHLELVDPADVPRFKQLGVVADFQPYWAIRDEYVTDLTEPILGPTRSARLYPMGDLQRAGAALAFGSDWPVTTKNPYEAIQTAVTRRATDQPAGPAWLPDQALDLRTVVEGYTRGNAYLCHAEQRLGTLEVGKAADLVVLDRDLFAIPATELHAVKPVATVLAGHAVFQEPGLGLP